MCDVILGPKASRGRKRGDIPLERYSDGAMLKPVHEGIRCYPLGLTYEKPKAMAAPNANGKVLGGYVDPNSDMRTKFMMVTSMSILLCLLYTEPLENRLP